MTTATVGRGSRLLGALPRPRITIRRLGALALAAVILFCAFLWFRSSSLVAIRQVTVTGLSGAEVSQIRSTLSQEATTMTTLNISTAKLESSVSGYRHIAAITVSTHFPHAVTIHVEEQIPVATISANGAQVAVDGAGELLARESTSGLPALSAAPEAGGDQVTSAGTLATLAVLAAAPYQLLPHIASAKATAAHGVVVQLRDGPALYFGNTTQLTLKWEAADATLNSSDSAGAAYIDVSAPRRPAAGTAQ